MTRDIYFLDLVLVELLGMDLLVFSATPLHRIALREPEAQFDYGVVVPPAMRTVRRTRRMMTTTTRRRRRRRRNLV